MSVEVWGVGGAEEGRGRGRGERPVSGGLWAVLGWLRRHDRDRDSSSSSNSLSSAGSARTAASFAFLPPPSSPRLRASPLPPLAPPTDSYRRRIRESNLRKQQDRDLTLHRKYGLYYGYDAFSLPHGRKNLADSENRDRRAASESLPRRTAYVPGKRRAPLPPARPHSIASAASLTRRHNRKRPAPQPPTVTTNENVNKQDENKAVNQLDIRLEMNDNTERANRRRLAEVNKESKTDNSSTKNVKAKDPKIRSEKSFLRQIFENKKRNSTIEPTERILPSISELDRQAAEIIESCKLKPVEQNNNTPNTHMLRGEAWFCTRCLRKYDSSVVTCQYCLPEQKRLSGFGFKGDNSTQTEKQKFLNGSSSNRGSGVGPDEKQKLKEMLKEMKDSLPKRPKHENVARSPKMMYKFDSTGRNSSSFETETLRIGVGAPKQSNDVNPVPSTSKITSDTSNANVSEILNIEQILPKIKPEPLTQNVVITQHVVLMGPRPKTNSEVQNTPNDSGKGMNSDTNGDILINKAKEENSTVPPNIVKINNTPLKISSLLNPVYIPKVNVTEDKVRTNFDQPRLISNQVTADAAVSTLSAETIAKTTALELPEVPKQENKVEQPLTNSTVPLMPTITTTTATNISLINNNQKIQQVHSNMAKFNVNQRSRNRDLINQLEQSIAMGDEKAAAEAAVKLAQLRLSCSVLSFASQIMAGTSGATTSSTGNALLSNKIEHVKLATPSQSNKVNAAVQSLATPTSNKNAKSKELPEKNIKEVKLSANTPNSNACIKNTGPDFQKPSTSSETSTPQQITDDLNTRNQTMIQVWVEDREATRGPLRLRISRRAVMGDLRRQAETSLGLAGALQRWIVGRALCTDDRVPLHTLAGPDLSAPFYLCVVEAENGGSGASTSKITAPKPDDNKDANLKELKHKQSDVYSELVQLEQQAIVANAEPFECGVCMEMCPGGRGAILRECVHMFCRDCLSDLVRYSEEPVVTCPAMGCPGVLQEREIRALVSMEEYERWLARGLAAAESGTRNAFHCRTRDCTGWAFCDPEVRKFPCPVCRHTNCIPCQAIHEDETCEQYLRKIQDATSAVTSTSQTDEGTRALLDTLIRKGEALECPECSAIITKKWGCDWVKCSACKTEICWVTRGRRWGPDGKGDTSGGCRCGVDGKRCHPSCGYCH